MGKAKIELSQNNGETAFWLELTEPPPYLLARVLIMTIDSSSKLDRKTMAGMRAAAQEIVDDAEWQYHLKPGQCTGQWSRGYCVLRKGHETQGQKEHNFGGIGPFTKGMWKAEQEKTEE